LEFAQSLGVDVSFVTRELSDLTWKTARNAMLDVCKPHPLCDRSTPEKAAESDALMMGADWAVKSSQLIEQDRNGRTGLIATVGKDYVIDPRNRAGQCTIYGWHQLNGLPIQPVSSVHENTYHDYSHHPRLARKVQ
jgi:hypothetical protein